MAIQTYWQGLSGTQYPFEVFTLETQFNAIAGVYVACMQLPNGSYGAIYVGQTHSFHERINAGFRGHEGLQRAWHKGARYIGLMTVSVEADRRAAEMDLIHGLNPSANKQLSANYGYFDPNRR